MNRQYERAGPRLADKRFYASKAWLQTRAIKLQADPLCEVCKASGRIVAARDVHHIRERKDFPDLALDQSNLQSLCQPCHGRKRRVS